MILCLCPQDYCIALEFQPYLFMKVKPLSYIKSYYWYPRQVEVMNLLHLGNLSDLGFELVDSEVMRRETVHSTDSWVSCGGGAEG